MKAKDLIKLIPSKVRITRKISYEVLWCDEFPGCENQVGACRLDLKQIIIKNGQSPTDAFRTYIHEVFHAISEETPKLNLTENQVGLLDESVFRVLKLNNLLDRK